MSNIEIPDSELWGSVGIIVSGCLLSFWSWRGVKRPRDGRFDWITRDLSDREKSLYRLLLEHRAVASSAVWILTTLCLGIGVYGLSGIGEGNYRPRDPYLLVLVFGLLHLLAFAIVWYRAKFKINGIVPQSLEGYVPPSDPRSHEQQWLAKLGQSIVVLGLVYYYFLWESLKLFS